MNTQVAWRACAAVLVAALGSACGGELGKNTASTTDDERGNVGPANPASVYCIDRGGKVESVGSADAGVDAANADAGEADAATESSLCVFSDGSTCAPWLFYRGQCGQSHTYCASQGGTVTSVDENRGTFWVTYARCTMPSGAVCTETDFLRNKVCK